MNKIDLSKSIDYKKIAKKKKIVYSDEYKKIVEEADKRIKESQRRNSEAYIKAKNLKVLRFKQ